MQFAASTCPYLANSKYTKRIDAGTVNPDKVKGNLMFLDQTMDPTRPELFVAVMSIGQRETENGYLVPIRPYRRMEVWQNGKLIREYSAQQIKEFMK
jgi:hypothetical protein